MTIEFTAAQSDLVSALRPAARIADRSMQTQPVLAHAHLALRGDDRLVVRGSDTVTEVVARVAVTGPVPTELEFTADARRLASFVALLPDDKRVWFAVDATANTLKVGSGGVARATFRSLPTEDFPVAAPVGRDVEFEMPAESFDDLFRRTEFAAGQDDPRHYLNGIMLEITEAHCRAVGTDGYRMAVCTHPVEGLVKPGARVESIIPRRAVGEIRKLLATADGAVCRVRIDGGALCAVVKDAAVRVGLVDGRYPDYERVIPKRESSVRLVAERQALSDALARILAIKGSDQMLRVNVTHGKGSDTVGLEAVNTQDECVGAQISLVGGGAPDAYAGFNAASLREVVAAIATDEVEITLPPEGKATLIEGAGDSEARYVLMRMGA